MGQDSWEELRAQRPLNERRVATYSRLLEAQIEIARALQRRGLAPGAIEHALEAGEPDEPEHEADRELYLGTLGRYVKELGGELRQTGGGLIALFEGDAVPVGPAPGS